jgi:hypothetical protein
LVSDIVVYTQPFHDHALWRALLSWIGLLESKLSWGFGLQHITGTVNLRLDDSPPEQGVSWLWPISERSSSDFPIQ